jgi:UDP-2,4-diacetamido-2,4,6-trideoxy-beta-L-altropyranose hydrolase
MKALIFTETGPKIGYGHLSRCLSLGFALQERGIKCEYIIAGQFEKSISELTKLHVQYHDWINNFEKIFERLDKYSIAIFDSYNITDEIVKKIYQSRIYPVFIDDLNEIQYKKGLVINSSALSENLEYPVVPNVTYLLGPKYLMLKKEFWNSKSTELKEIPKEVLISVGATDQHDLSSIIIENLMQFNSNFLLRVIVTEFFTKKGLEKIYSLQKSHKFEIHNSPNTIEMRNLMDKSDIAVCSGGQTSLELASLNIPSIIIVTAKNQQVNAQFLSSNNIALNSGRWDDPNLWEKFKVSLSEISSYELRKSMIENIHLNIKSDGSKDIVKCILKKIKKEYPHED